jgi:hypothetical protein
LRELNVTFKLETPRPWIIKDWAGNTCFHGKDFFSFEDAEEYLSEQFGELPDDEYEVERGEYFIQLKSEG